jgi:hypothetical protein
MRYASVPFILSILMMNISRNVDIINENEIVWSIHYLVLDNI